MPSGRNGRYQAFLKAITLSLYDFREVDASGNVSAIAGNGGILASDTTPIMRGNSTSKSAEVSWAAGNADKISIQHVLPNDFDGTEDVVVDLWVYSGTTNPATFTVETGWDNGTFVSSTATDAVQSATMHKISVTIPATSIPDAASLLTMVLTPPTHATDAIQLMGARVSYLAKTF